MEEDVTFLNLLVRAIHKTERVLMYYGLAPERENQLWLEPHIQALSTLCRQQGRDLEGVVDLQGLQQMLGIMAKGGTKPETFSGGKQRAERYERWLVATFPKETGPVCRWPFLRRVFRKANHLCEQCRKRSATVHITEMSTSGIERHEYCESCHREIEGKEYK